MKVESHVSLDYLRVNPFEGINAIEDSLIQNRFLVVSDEESNYYGILLPSDIVTRPHKLVIDCLIEKPVIDSELDIKAVFDLMINKKHAVLPVFKDNSFIGIISADKAGDIMKSYTEELLDIIIENTAEIDQLKKEVQVSERLKISLLQNINHEIRTPLAGLVGFSSLLVSDDKTEKEKADYIDIIEKSSNRFLYVMENLINLSRIQAGDKSTTTPYGGTIGQMLREVYLYYKSEKKQNGKDHLSFKYDYQINDRNVYCLDFNCIKQILGYLLDNAFKYTEKGEIELGCMPVDGNELKFYIKDTGIGISSDKIRNVFNAFNQISVNKGDTNNGLGLGLAIAKKLTLSMGGQIKVESEVDKGACFIVTIPLAK